MAMSSSYSVTRHALDRHAAHLEASRSEFIASLNRFGESLSTLPSVWKGSSYTSFAQVQAKWQNAAGELERALEQIRQQVGTSAHIYDQGETEQTAAIGATDRSIDWSAGTYRH